MSNAVMPLAHYKETCDAIREKTGSTDTIKSREMPDKINDVFRAGQLGIVSSAEALKGSASGSSVTIKDISSVEHNVNCKVGSKNLLNAMEIADYNTSTDYVKDIENNSFTLRGNEGGLYLAGSGQLMLPYANTENITQKGVKVKGGVKYTVSFDLLIMEQGIYNSNISLLIYTSALGNIPAGIVEGTLGTTVRRSITFTPTTDEIIGFCFRINNNYVTLSNIQVEEGSTATAYTPYVSSENLLQSPYPFESETITGIKSKVNADGSIEIDWNLKEANDVDLYLAEELYLPVGTYTFKKNMTCEVFGIPDDYEEWQEMYGVDVLVFQGLPHESEPLTSPFTITNGYIPIFILINLANCGVQSWMPERAVIKLKPLLYKGTKHISDVKVQRLGKNLFNSDLTLKTQTVNGITVDNEGDGIFHFCGTATQTFTYSFMVTNIGVRIDPSKTYIVSAKVLEGKVENINSLHPYIGIGATPTESQNYNSATLKSDSVAGKIYSTPYPTPVINIKSDAKYITRFWLYAYGIQEGAPIDFKIKVWIIQGSVGEEYEPYIKPTEHTANADGTVDGIKSLYPTTTLMTDTQGVIITAEYIKDIDKAFEERLAALEAAIVNNE